jgi:hypothetical protein
LGPAVLIGDPFVFRLVGANLFVSGTFSSAEPFGHGATSFDDSPLEDYSLSWSENAGVLTSIRLWLDTRVDTLSHFGLTGGGVSSDNEIAGCNIGPCQISGYWVNTSVLTAPEPGSLALLASAFGVCGFTRRRRVSEH